MSRQLAWPGMQTMSEAGRPLLLDTHAWVWLVEGRQDVQKVARVTLEQASEDSLLRLCANSMWEVAMLEARGRLRFDIPGVQWLEAALGIPGLSLVPLTPSICRESSRLPGAFHGDPADRLIVATARQSHARLVTRDRQILDWFSCLSSGP